jgi:hypothetical protein
MASASSTAAIAILLPCMAAFCFQFHRMLNFCTYGLNFLRVAFTV